MDIDKVSFFPLLLDILEDIEQAKFVAIDLELSGVPTKQDRAKGRSGKPPIADRYLEIKQAAEKYHILQFGLTCVSQDAVTGKYVCKPYNFDISPSISDLSLGIERAFTFSSSAVHFLHSVSFDFQRPFYNGIEYLRPAELAQAKVDFDARQQRNALPDMTIKDTDVEALALFEKTRKAIKAWLAKNKGDWWLNIGPEGFDKVSADSTAPPPEFNRFEKRLVHQLVRANFPQLTSYSKYGFVQIAHRDEKYEARALATKKAAREKDLLRQKGFAWIVDAIFGRISSPIDLSPCCFHPVTAEAVAMDMADLEARFEAVMEKLRQHPRVIVGHNCFLDLVYIYHTFVGPLPDNIDDFVEALHSCSPTIIDTKYMATHNCGDINPSSSLQEIAEELRPKLGDDPVDTVDEEHSKYAQTEHFHEAGFDSLLTAQVAIRLSMKLDKSGAYLQDLENELGGVSLSDSKPAGKIGTVVNKTKGAVGAVLSKVGLVNDTSHVDGANDAVDQTFNGMKQGSMPSFGGDFWKVYGNNLRVFGTEEGLLSLQ